MKKYTRVKNIVKCKSIVSSIVCDVCGKVIEQCNNYHEVSYSEYVGQDVYTRKADVCLDCAPSYAHSLISLDDVVSYSDKLEYANIGGENTTNLNVIDFREELNKSIRAIRDIKFLLEGSVELVQQDIDVAIQECADEIKHLASLIQVYDVRIPVESEE